MGKSRNRNQQKLDNHGVIDVTGAKGSQKNKPFIGVNVYTKEDDAIIKRMLKDPNWSVPKIKDALPYKHTTKNIMNKLLQFCSQKEIDAHAIDKTAPSTPAPKPEQSQALPKAKTINAKIRWTEDELDVLRRNMDTRPLNDPVWEKLIPNHSQKAIYNKVHRLRSETPKPKMPKRINGWLESDVELLNLVMSEPDDKPLPELMQDLIDSFDEKHTAVEVNKMVESLGLVMPDKKTAKQEENNMANTQKMTEPTDNKLALLGQLYTLVGQFPENVSYDIHVNFGGGIHFDVSKRPESEQNHTHIK